MSGYQLAMGWTVRESNPGGGEIVHIQSSVQQVPSLFSGGKADGAWR
jgi:hypothetical protein